MAMVFLVQLATYKTYKNNPKWKKTRKYTGVHNLCVRALIFATIRLDALGCLY